MPSLASLQINDTYPDREMGQRKRARVTEYKDSVHMHSKYKEARRMENNQTRQPEIYNLVPPKYAGHGVFTPLSPEDYTPMVLEKRTRSQKLPPRTVLGVSLIQNNYRPVRPHPEEPFFSKNSDVYRVIQMPKSSKTSAVPQVVISRCSGEDTFGIETNRKDFIFMGAKVDCSLGIALQLNDTAEAKSDFPVGTEIYIVINWPGYEKCDKIPLDLRRKRLVLPKTKSEAQKVIMDGTENLLKDFVSYILKNGIHRKENKWNVVNLFKNTGRLRVMGLMHIYDGIYQIVLVTLKREKR